MKKQISRNDSGDFKFPKEPLNRLCNPAELSESELEDLTESYLDLMNRCPSLYEMCVDDMTKRGIYHKKNTLKEAVREKIKRSFEERTTF